MTQAQPEIQTLDPSTLGERVTWAPHAYQWHS